MEIVIASVVFFILKFIVPKTWEYFNNKDVYTSMNLSN